MNEVRRRVFGCLRERHDTTGPNSPPHHLRYALTERMGKLTVKGTIIRVWPMTLVSGLKYQGYFHVPANKLYHKDTPPTSDLPR